MKYLITIKLILICVLVYMLNSEKTEYSLNLKLSLYANNYYEQEYIKANLPECFKKEGLDIIYRDKKFEVIHSEEEYAFYKSGDHVIFLSTIDLEHPYGKITVIIDDGLNYIFNGSLKFEKGITLPRTKLKASFEFLAGQTREFNKNRGYKPFAKKLLGLRYPNFNIEDGYVKTESKHGKLYDAGDGIHLYIYESEYHSLYQIYRIKGDKLYTSGDNLVYLKKEYSKYVHKKKPKITNYKSGYKRRFSRIISESKKEER